MTQDDFGRVYRNSNSSALHHRSGADAVLPPQSESRPHAWQLRVHGRSGRTERHVSRCGPNRGVNRGYQTGQLRADGTLATYTAVCAPTVYRGDRLPAELAGNVFLAEPSGNLVSRVIISDDGTHAARAKGLRQRRVPRLDRRAVPAGLPVLGARTARCTSSTCTTASSSTRASSPSICATTSSRASSRAPSTRAASGGSCTTRRGATRSRGCRPSRRRSWSARLGHPNGWWRDTAQQLLVQRGDKTVAPALKKLAETAPDPRTRLHALWTLDGLDSLEPATVIKALDDQSRDVRASAVRLAERFLAEPNSPVPAALLKRIDDTDWAVREQLAASLGELPPGPRETALATMLERQGSDPVVVDAALSGLRGGEAAVLASLLQSTATSPARETAITMLAATLVRGGQDAAVQTILQQVADAGRPAWQRAAILRGAEVSLLGAAAPGSPAGRGGRGGGGGRRPGRRSDRAWRPRRSRRRARVSPRRRRPCRRGLGRPGGGGGRSRTRWTRRTGWTRRQPAAAHSRAGHAQRARRRPAAIWARARPRFSRASSGPANRARPRRSRRSRPRRHSGSRRGRRSIKASACPVTRRTAAARRGWDRVSSRRPSRSRPPRFRRAF